MASNPLIAGFKVIKQEPLDGTSISFTLATLANLGTNNQLAYTYHDGRRILCLEDRKLYEWREVGSILSQYDETGGLISGNFTYPANVVAFGIDYSNKAFNFFEATIIGDTGNGIVTVVLTNTVGLIDTYTITYTDNTISTFNVANGNGISGIALTGTVGLVDTYTITFDDGTTATYTVTNGSNGIAGRSIVSVTLTATVGLAKTYTITYSSGSPSTFVVLDGAAGADATANNLQKEISSNYILDDDDNNYTIFVNNEATPVTITIPDGLMDSFSAGFVQEGTANVSFVMGGVETLHTAVGNKIKGQFKCVLVEKKLATTDVFLLGDTKV